MADLMGGVVNVAMDTVAVTEPFIRAGKMRLIASAYSGNGSLHSRTRRRWRKKVFRRSISRRGSASWSASATPKERIDRARRRAVTIAQSPEIAEKFSALGALPRAKGPEAFGEFLKSEDARWGAIVKKSGVHIE